VSANPFPGKPLDLWKLITNHTLRQLHVLFASMFALNGKTTVHDLAGTSLRPRAIESGITTAINTVRKYLERLPKSFFQDARNEIFESLPPKFVEIELD